MREALPCKMISSVSGNVVGCTCFRILFMNCGVWSADVHGRMFAVEGGCYSLGYSAPDGFGLDPLDANYRRTRRSADLCGYVASAVYDRAGQGDFRRDPRMTHVLLVPLQISVS